MYGHRTSGMAKKIHVKDFCAINDQSKEEKGTYPLFLAVSASQF